MSALANRAVRFLGWALAALALVGPARAAEPVLLEQTYAAKPLVAWEVHYPTGWTVDDHDPSAVVLTTSDPSLGMVTLTDYYNSDDNKIIDLDKLVDDLIVSRTKSFAERGLTYTILSREKGTLPDGTGFVLFTDQIGSTNGGRSEILLTMKGPGILSVVAETYASDWPAAADTLDAIVRSVRLLP
jgi:hypothetical protein